MLASTKDVLSSLWSFIKKTPVTMALTAAIIVVGITTKSLWESAGQRGLVETHGFGLPAFSSGDWLSLITGASFAPEPWMYILIIPPLLIGAGYIEYHYGAWRMLATIIFTHVVSVVLVAGMLWLFSESSVSWAQELALVKDVGFSNGAFGAIGVATAALNPYWRFRVRLIISLYLSAMVLYAADVWDFTHLVAFGVGLSIGPWVIGRAYEKINEKFNTINARAFTASLLVFYALSHIISKVHPGNGGLLDFGGAHASDPTFLFMTILSFVALWFSFGLYKGRRLAWWCVLAIATVLAVGAFFQLSYEVSPIRIFNLGFNIILIMALIIFRKDFSAKADMLTVSKLITRLIIVAVGIALLHVVILYQLRHSFAPEPGLDDVIAESLYQVFGLTTGEFIPTTGIAHTVLATINDVWIVFLLVTIASLVVTTKRDTEEGGRAVYEGLLKRWGGSTLSWMGTWNKIHYYMNSSKTAILSYYLSGNVAIVLADPIGERRTVSELTKSFDRYCRGRGWTVAYFSSSATTMRLLKKQGYKSVQVAQDSIVLLKNLEFKGKSWQSVRSSINKAEKLGVSMRVVRLSDTSLAIRDQLEAIERSWEQDKALPEMGFTLGALHEAEDPEVRMHLAIDEDGTVHGMTSWLPVYGGGGEIKGWTLDIMQRRLSEKTMPGVMEFLIAESAQAFKEEGYEFISLSGAPLSGIENSDNLVERVLNWASVKFEPYYGFSSLHKFKEKFQPSYEKMYLCYRESDQLPAIGVAIGRAYMGDISLLQAGVATLKDKK